MIMIIKYNGGNYMTSKCQNRTGKKLILDIAGWIDSIMLIIIIINMWWLFNKCHCFSCVIRFTLTIFLVQNRFDNSVPLYYDLSTVNLWYSPKKKKQQNKTTTNKTYKKQSHKKFIPKHIVNRLKIDQTFIDQSINLQ